MLKRIENGNPFVVILAALVGIPMYADIFGTIPVAESLLAKGASLGTILSFMMAVTTLSLPSLIMLKKAVKPELLAAFIGICTAGIIVTVHTGLCIYCKVRKNVYIRPRGNSALRRRRTLNG